MLGIHVFSQKYLVWNDWEKREKKYQQITNLENSQVPLKTLMRPLFGTKSLWVNKFIWEKQEIDLRCGAVMSSKTVKNG